jgi:hypothetical protein
LARNKTARTREYVEFARALFCAQGYWPENLRYATPKMPLELGEAVNNAASWVCTAPLVRGIVSNPVFTALLITALVVVVIMALYGTEVRNGAWKRKARLGIYVFMLVTAVVFVHHYAVTATLRSQMSREDVHSQFQSIRMTGGMQGASSYPVGKQAYDRLDDLDARARGDEFADELPLAGPPVTEAPYSPSGDRHSAHYVGRARPVGGSRPDNVGGDTLGPYLIEVPLPAAHLAPSSA